MLFFSSRWRKKQTDDWKEATVVQIRAKHGDVRRKIQAEMKKKKRTEWEVDQDHYSLFRRSILYSREREETSVEWMMDFLLSIGIRFGRWAEEIIRTFVFLQGIQGGIIVR